MTGKDYKDQNIEWLKTVKVGDEVCVTNTHNVIRKLFGTLFDASIFGASQDSRESTELCSIHKVRGILPDGSFVVENYIYNPNGELEGNHVAIDNKCELVQPTEELVHLSWKLKFMRDVKLVDFREFSNNSIQKLVTIINEEILILKEKEDERKRRQEEREAREKKARENSPFATIDSGRTLFSPHNTTKDNPDE